MNKIASTALLGFLKMATDGNLVDHIVEEVRKMASAALSGADKRQAVLDGLKAIGGDLGPVVAATGTVVLNLLLEGAVVYVQAHSNQ